LPGAAMARNRSPEHGVISSPIMVPRSIDSAAASPAATTNPCAVDRADARTPPRSPERVFSMSSHHRSRVALAVVALVALVGALAVLTLAGAPPAEAKKHVLNIAAKEPDTLDPHASILGQTQAIIRFVYRGLTKFAVKDGKVTTAEVEPDLAESWTVSPDGLVWTFKIRKGVQFHKGYGELTAEDVKFSFERQINRAPGTRLGKNVEMTKPIEVAGPYPLQIVLKSFDPVFPLRMAGYEQGYIVSKKAVDKLGDQFRWSPVGTGPFYFDRHAPREKVVL